MPRLTAWRKPRWCDTLAQASLATGDRAAVEHWAELARISVEQLPSPGRNGFAVRAGMRAHAARGELEAALQKAVEAFSDFSLSGERIEACGALLAAAELSLDAGRTHQVRPGLFPGVVSVSAARGPYEDPGRRGARMVPDRVGTAPPNGGAHQGGTQTL